MSIETLTLFFGWTTIINIVVLLLTTAAVLLLRDRVVSIHAKLFGLDAGYLRQAYFRYLAQFKIATLVFSLTPYLALKLMS